MRADTNDYLSLFLNDVPLIDSRAPVEFARGAFPTSVNLPLMMDREREQVGTCYKNAGQEAAIQLGHALVNGDIKTQRVQHWVEFAQQNPHGYLYCFRGGLRSQICQHWMHEAGCDYPRVMGGYKAMRRFLLDQLEAVCSSQQALILAGHTGAAKTDLLQGLPAAVDLEAIANHRGSAFGRKPDGQPSQTDFENRLIINLLKIRHLTPYKTVVLEDESRLIGCCALPLCLRDLMARSPVVMVTSDLDSRVEHSWRNYILRKSQEWCAEVGEELAFDYFAEDLRNALLRISRRLGPERYQQLQKKLEAALTAHKSGFPDLHKDWIRSLLRDYYDPMYEWHWRRHKNRVVFTGTATEVQQWVHQQLSEIVR